MWQIVKWPLVALGIVSLLSLPFLDALGQKPAPGMPRFYVGRGVDLPTLERAAAVWTALGWGEFRRGLDVPGPTERAIYIQVDQHWLDRAEPQNKEWLGFAQPSGAGCMIVLCDHLRSGDLCELDHVMVAHEIGHCLGFEHVDDPSPHLMAPLRHNQALTPRALEGLAR